MAERIYKPFLVPITNTEKFKQFSLIVNTVTVVETRFYSWEGYYKIIHASSFKSVLAFIKNPYAPYISVSNNQYIDVLAWVIANGGSYEFCNSSWLVTL